MMLAYSCYRRMVTSSVDNNRVWTRFVYHYLVFLLFLQITASDSAQDDCYRLGLTFCTKCTPDGSTCTECVLGYGFSPPDGSYGCDVCNMAGGCAHCSDVGTCVTCADHSKGPLHDGSGGCGDCALSCTMCTQTGAGKCDPMQCEPGYALLTYDQSCSPCKQDCPSCGNTGPGQCDTCLKGEGPPSGVITVDPVFGSPSNCVRCSVLNCISCLMNSDICQECSSGYVLDTEANACNSAV